MKPSIFALSTGLLCLNLVGCNSSDDTSNGSSDDGGFAVNDTAEDPFANAITVSPDDFITNRETVLIRTFYDEFGNEQQQDFKVIEVKENEVIAIETAGAPTEITIGRSNDSSLATYVEVTGKLIIR
ncbi:hypothetical protein JCM19240_2217 [Vibrio maritimus]|uniref:Uncharacterized protein n=1 Tax=Vibrio maritimus TaxID=990268 RepID=A0A090T0T3_9VIBR|nr:hypothetical protein JCM19240_2217 [Vibrio maritimus]